MNDKQQLAAMGERMREMEELSHKKHSVTQVLAWADDYEKIGGHGLIVEMLKSYSELLSSSQCKREFKVPDGWRLVPIEPTCYQVLVGRNSDSMDDELCVAVYLAMLAAAPEYNP